MNINRIEQFKIECEKVLRKYPLKALQSYATTLEFRRPSDIKIDEIIPLIIGALTGEIKPDGRVRVGRPSKNNSVPTELIAEIEALKRKYLYKENEIGLEEANVDDFIAVPSKLVFSSDDIEEEHWTETINKAVVRGQLQVLNEVSRLLPLDCGGEKEPIVVPAELVNKHGLREGDVIACHTVKSKNVSIVKEILTVNDTQLMFLKREKFEENEVCYPHKIVPFVSQNTASISAKYAEWILPLYQGQRGLILSSPKAGKTELLYALAAATLKASQSVKVLALLNAQSLESVWKFRKVVPEDQLVYTTYEDVPEKQVFAAEFILKRAKRLAECGKNVVLFVDSLTALARAYNETEESIGGKVLAGGLESKTLQYMRRFFSSARCFKQGGSLTLLGTVACDTGNPFDELLSLDLSNLSNYQICLSEALSARRVYPAIDLSKSFTCPGELGGGTERVYQQVCHEILPNRGEEALCGMLESCDDYSAFLNEISVKK